METVARIYTDFPEKFGIPRQSGLLKGNYGRIVFEDKYRSPDAVKGLSGFDYIWILWIFDVKESGNFVATVRPPRLNGEHVGVFASRSPFRPNHIGLSSVKLVGIDLESDEAPVLIVESPDMVNGTKIVDIKPYIPYADSHSDAGGGYTEVTKEYALHVDFPKEYLEKVSDDKREALIGLLSQDPRPFAKNNPEHEFGVSFAGYNVRFVVKDSVLKVTDVERITR